MSVIKFKQFPADVQETIESVNGLKQALNRLETGSQDTPRSWFFEDKDPADVLAQVTQKLNGSKDLREISDYDLSKVDKFGPQGGAAPLKERLETFEEYFLHLDSPKIVNDPIFKKAKKLAIQRLKFNEAGVPLTLKAVIDRGMGDQKYNTNSGYPLYCKRKSDVAIENVLSVGFNAIIERYPCTLGSRATMGKTGTKARHIFMASMPVNCCGQRYAIPLQDYIRSRHEQFFAPWEGWTEVQKLVSEHWDKGLKFGADYTKMDQHFNLHHALQCFDVIKHYFRKAYWDELETTIRYVFEVPILTNLGYVDQAHAMPSGSEWTNFLETMWNYIFTIYLELKYHLEFVCKMGIGDDQLYILAGKWTPKAIKWITDIVVSEFDYSGLPGNPEKQEVGDAATSFLQRFMCSEWDGNDDDTRAAGVYSLVRNLTSQIYPERYHNDKEWDKRMFALRCIMIAENANQHPLFKWYIQNIVAKANPNILEFCRESEQQAMANWQRAKNIANFLPTYNQEKQDSAITEFDSYKLLRELCGSPNDGSK